jgi:hypothetical protein
VEAFCLTPVIVFVSSLWLVLLSMLEMQVSHCHIHSTLWSRSKLAGSHSEGLEFDVQSDLYEYLAAHRLKCSPVSK